MAKYRAVSHVIFDMDGVLLDTEPLYTKAIQNVVSRYGKTFTWEQKSQMMGLQTAESSKFIVKALDLPLTWEEYTAIILEEYRVTLANPEIIPDTEGMYRKAIATIAKRFGKNYTSDIVAKVTGTVERESARIAVTEMKLPMPVEEFQNEFRRLSHDFFSKYGVSTFPGAKKLVEHLSKHNIPISVATSSSEDSFELKTAKHKDFFKLFDHIVCGGSDPDVKQGKPAPDIFLVSASRFPDGPNPEKCLVFEDAPNGVQAAVNAGMQVVMCPDENVPLELRKNATLVVSSLDETPVEAFGLPKLGIHKC